MKETERVERVGGGAQRVQGAGHLGQEALPPPPLLGRKKSNGEWLPGGKG